MLRGAAEASGHTVHVCDLNADMTRHLRSRATSTTITQAKGASPANPAVPGAFRGDHDKDIELWGPVACGHDEAMLHAFAPCEPVHGLPEDAIKHMWYNARAVQCAADRLLASAYGTALAAGLQRSLLACGRVPQVIGVSVMFAGQVPAAVAVSRLVRDHCPSAVLVWGGPHVTALRESIAADTSTYSRWCGGVHAFVAGYAELTFVALLDAVAGRQSAAASRSSAHVNPVDSTQGSAARLSAVAAAPHAGTGCTTSSVPSLFAGQGDIAIRPSFPSDLHVYCSAGTRLTLPAQLRRGCAYGLCAFCTYPQVEGRPAGSAHVSRAVLRSSGVLELAAAYRLKDVPTVVSFKDALMSRGDLLAVAEAMLAVNNSTPVALQPEALTQNGWTSSAPPATHVTDRSAPAPTHAAATGPVTDIAHLQEARSISQPGSDNKGIEWSACTKLSGALVHPEFLQLLVDSGCRTLELGVETLDVSTAALIRKPQSEAVLLLVLDAAARVGLPLVLNYITGFPGEGAAAADAYTRLQRHVSERCSNSGAISNLSDICVQSPAASQVAIPALGSSEWAPRTRKLVAQIQHNTFQLERLSPMGKDPSSYKLQVLVDPRQIPFATVLPHRDTTTSRVPSRNASSSTHASYSLTERDST